MHIFVTHHVVPIVLASAHGLRDLARPLAHLWPYALVPVLLPPAAATPAFLAASVIHFARDVGTPGSVLLHVTWGALALAGMEEAAWTLFALYYCGVHALPRRALPSAALLALRLLLVGALLLTTITPSPAAPNALHVGPTLQLLVVAHVVRDEADHRAA